MNLADAERLLDLGRLEMRRPSGDWVPARRARRTRKRRGHYASIDVVIERAVLAAITEAHDAEGQPDLREAARAHVIERGRHLIDSGCRCSWCYGVVMQWRDARGHA